MADLITQPAVREQSRQLRPGTTSQTRSHLNVSDTERLISILGGSALAILGLSRGSLGGLLGAAVGGTLVYRGLTGHCPVYHAAGIDTRKRAPATAVPAGEGVKIVKNITVNRSAGELYRFWRDFNNLSRIMQHLESVEVLDERRSRWTAKSPLGTSVSWEAEIINERPNELIAWRSLDGSQVDTAGSVHFRPAPGGRGTEVQISLKYEQPAGKMGAAVARLFGRAPEQQIQEDLRRFKQLVEAGEVTTSRGPSGRR